MCTYIYIYIYLLGRALPQGGGGGTPIYKCTFIQNKKRLFVFGGRPAEGAGRGFLSLRCAPSPSRAGGAVWQGQGGGASGSSGAGMGQGARRGWHKFLLSCGA